MRHCTCMLSDLARIPCLHAQATINYIHQIPYVYINDIFSKNKLFDCYCTYISPVIGSNLWPQTSFIKLLPPMAGRMHGRPKISKRRRVSENEGRFSIGRVARCGKCFEYGHKSKGCKNATRELIPNPPKKILRPRKVPIKHRVR